MTNSSQFYSWQNFRCAYTVDGDTEASTTTPLVLIHPIGVGLSGKFWRRFTEKLLLEKNLTIYNPDLLGCGDCDMPAVAYYPLDWAKQLQYFIEKVVKQPVVIVVQGASFPIAIKLSQLLAPHWIKGLILSAPPAWRTMRSTPKPRQQKLLWNLLFNSPVGLGNLFYRYARRRQFLESFSIRQLFADAEEVDREWLDELIKGAADLQSRYGVFSFLAGFWREDYATDIANIEQRTIVIFGEQSSSISKEGKAETVEDRLNSYTTNLPQGQGCVIPGRNVLPYESTTDFVKVVTDFLN